MDMRTVLLTLALLAVAVGGGMAKTQYQGTDDIPKEGYMFYKENGKTRSVKPSTRADKVEWTFTSVIENCFDTSKKGKEAWLMTADGETQLKLTFQFKNPDEDHEIEEAEVLFCFYEGKDIFNEEKLDFITDVKITGTFKKEVEKNAINIIMTAPEAFPDPTISWYKYYVIVLMKLKGVGEAVVARQVGVSRNGLFLLHGLNSSRDCFFPFREYLLKTAKNYFVNQIYLGDYSSSNTSSFHANTHDNDVVKNSLKHLSDNLLLAGIASTKYDMVGHSMGGILERLYIQEVDDAHTNRLITLNTPHLGSIFGNIYIKYEEFLQDHPGVELYHGVEKFNEILAEAFSKDHSMQAVKDLAKNSPAIQNLQKGAWATLGIPVCAVGSEINDWSFRMAAKETFYAVFPKLASVLFDSTPGTGKAYLDKEAQKGSDYVVSVESQKGGCEKNFIYKGDYSQAMHCKVTEWNIIHEELNKLLSSPETYGLFTTGGFGEIPDPSRTRAEEEEKIDFITKFEEPKSTSFIKIEAKKVDGADYTHEIKLTQSDDVVAKVAFCLLNSDDIIADFDKDAMKFDMSGFEGEKWIYAFGRTNCGSGIQSVENSSELRYDLVGNNLKIENVSGPYTVAIYNYAGQMLAEMNSNPSHTYVLPRRKGLLIIGVRSDKDEQFIKVVTKQ